MDTMTSALRKAIRADGRAQPRIGIAAGVDRAVISRFVRGERSITLVVADRLCQALGVECVLVPVRKRRKEVKHG